MPPPAGAGREPSRAPLGRSSPIPRPQGGPRPSHRPDGRRQRDPAARAADPPLPALPSPSLPATAPQSSRGCGLTALGPAPLGSHRAALRRAGHSPAAAPPALPLPQAEPRPRCARGASPAARRPLPRSAPPPPGLRRHSPHQVSEPQTHGRHLTDRATAAPRKGCRDRTAPAAGEGAGNGSGDWSAFVTWAGGLSPAEA